MRRTRRPCLCQEPGTLPSLGASSLLLAHFIVEVDGRHLGIAPDAARPRLESSETDPALFQLLGFELPEYDPQKLFSWPVYVVGLRARLTCPAAVLVDTTKRSVAN